MADESKNEPEQQRAPAAISFATLQNFIEQFTEDTVPSQIDKSIMSNLPWGTQTLLIASLKSLGFISDANIPEPLFTNYVKADKDGRGFIWNKMLKDRYSFLLDSVDIGRTTTAVVSEKFKAQGINGDTIRKAITFFLHAAKAANLQVSPHVKAPRQTQGSKKAEKGESGKKAAKAEPAAVQPANTNTNNGGSKPERIRYEMLIDILDDEMTEPEKEAVWILIRYLKAHEAKGD